jgi:hypothetical protein
MARIGRRLAGLLAVAPLLLSPILASEAAAMCDIIPQVRNSFRAALGSTQRPYASPGDTVEITLDTEKCDDASPGFEPAANDNAVTLIFSPPDGPVSAVILTMGPGCGAIDVQGCRDELPVGATAECFDVGKDLSGSRFSFAFPDTDSLVIGSLRTLTGPVTIAVSPIDEDLPCELATIACDDPSLPANVSACIGRLHETDGTCGTADSQLHSTFPHFTALPFANDFSELCTEPGICVGTKPEVRYTIDSQGNLLIPIDWSAILVPGPVPIARLVRAGADLEAFDATPGVDPPIRLPSAAFLGSFTTQGHRLPPLFQPLADPEGDAAMFGSVDAERGVVYLRRRSPAFLECSGGDFPGDPCVKDAECRNGGSCVQASCRGGANDGLECAGDAQCPGGECGPGLFDFSDRLLDSTGTVTAGQGIGPGLVSSYSAEAQNPVALDGLAETDDLFMFVRSELLEGEDLNGDGDASDTAIVTLRDRDDGSEQELGGPGIEGISTFRADRFPTRIPTVAVEDDIVALVEDVGLSPPPTRCPTSRCGCGSSGSKQEGPQSSARPARRPTSRPCWTVGRSSSRTASSSTEA